MNPTQKTFTFGGQQVTIETGRFARQATGSALVTIGDTVTLAAAVAAPKAAPNQSFFPLSVHYQEKTYAAGKIPGGFFRREGRPSEKEILTSRLIDRPLRPLFPKGFRNEVQVVCTTLSVDKDVDPDISALLGASAALALSGVPFNGPIGAARVGMIGSEYLLNPRYSQLADSSLDMVVAGTRSAVLMVESQAQELDESAMLGAVLFAHREMQVAIDAIHALAAEAGKPSWTLEEPAPSPALSECRAQFGEALAEAWQITDKSRRLQRIASLYESAAEALNPLDGEEVRAAFDQIGKELVRGNVLRGGRRIDGRAMEDVRPIVAEVGLLPSTHGSAQFTRGETQAIAAATLGSMRDAQQIDALEGERKDPFMLHYNFPPYSVGEARRMMGPGRREIGHGRLARRGLAATLPDSANFPYAMRVVSEITESNGSSSMATVCAASLALMDAGVPVSAPVAGVAMGLVKDGDDYQVLTDILGDEDHLGDMDFKVAGSERGVTALQMDIKIEGIDEQIMSDALAKARVARVHILGEMAKALSEPRPEVSPRAPSMFTLRIPQDKIRDVIGKGGSTIRSITEETGADIDIDDDGTVRLYAPDKVSLDAARDRIRQLTEEPEIGGIYVGTVAKITDFGAFVTFLPGRDGLVHISQIAHRRIASVSEYLSEGEEVRVKVLDIDERGRVRLSIKALLEDGEQGDNQQRR